MVKMVQATIYCPNPLQWQPTFEILNFISQKSTLSALGLNICGSQNLGRPPKFLISLKSWDLKPIKSN